MQSHLSWLLYPPAELRWVYGVLGAACIVRDGQINLGAKPKAPNVREIEVGRNQNALLILAYFDDAFIRGATQRLPLDGDGVVAGGCEQVGGFDRQVLVYLEFHAASGTSSSRANAAA